MAPRGSSKITAPTPVFTRDLIVIASGRAPERPVFAINPAQPATSPSVQRDLESACALEQNRSRLVHAHSADL